MEARRDAFFSSNALHCEKEQTEANRIGSALVLLATQINWLHDPQCACSICTLRHTQHIQTCAHLQAHTHTHTLIHKSTHLRRVTTSSASMRMSAVLLEPSFTDMPAIIAEGSPPAGIMPVCVRVLCVLLCVVYLCVCVHCCLCCCAFARSQALKKGVAG